MRILTLISMGVAAGIAFMIACGQGPGPSNAQTGVSYSSGYLSLVGGLQTVRQGPFVFTHLAMENTSGTVPTAEVWVYKGSGCDTVVTGDRRGLLAYLYGKSFATVQAFIAADEVACARVNTVSSKEFRWSGFVP